MIDVNSLVNRRADNRWERVCVGDVFERNTWGRPDEEAIVGVEGAYADPMFARLSYRQADEIANRFAQGLLARGLARGDRVLLVCENSVEAYVAKIAVAKAGLVCVPINPALATDVVVDIVQRCEPKFVVVDAELWPRVSEVLQKLQLAVDVTIPIGGEALTGSDTFTGFVADQSATEPDVTVHGDDIFEILFTSGTTAMPKGVMLSHAYAHFAAYTFAMSLTRGLDHEVDARLCCFLPSIYHVTDLVFTFPAFLAGGKLILGRRPDARLAARTVTREGATAFYGGSSQMLRDFTEAVRSDSITYSVRTLTVIVFGWSNIPQGLTTLLQDLCGDDIQLFEIFGQTESIACHRFHLEEHREKYRRHAPEVNYVGLPDPLLAAAVVDSDGVDLRDRPGESGEAVYRSPAITAGYYLDEAATAEAFRGGWFHSGDICTYDEDGLRIMQDRSKDIVKSGGENVSTLRVEAVVHDHPSVLRAAVIGLPHERWGEAVTAIVTLRPEAQLDEGELIAFVRERLASFEAPKKVVVVPELPQTVGGKVLKYRLRNDLISLYSS